MGRRTFLSVSSLGYCTCKSFELSNVLNAGSPMDFSDSLLSKRYMIQLGNRHISLWYLPLILAFGFEFFQWMHWSNGSADLNDLLGAGLFWALGMTVFPEKEPKISLFQSFNIHALLCTGAYAVVYLAHVMN